MSTYILAFRGRPDRMGGPEQEAAWGRWFGEIGPRVVGSGSRLGRVTTVGKANAEMVMTGYTLIEADSHEAAVEVANGCPGLTNGGAVEVGETIPSP
jgi:hypothetical protein